MPAFANTPIACIIVLAAALWVTSGQASVDFDCEVGVRVSGDLGDGVTLHTCRWERTPGVFVRAGPLRLIKNGVVILKLQTDRDGVLQGEYSAWDDDGELTETGHYRDGLKEGEWRSVDEQGVSRVTVYRAGVAQDL